jgi:D-Tyr-tRNAtyr deacylase
MKTKKTLTLAILLCSMLSFGQSFEKLEANKDVNSLVINREFFNLFEKVKKSDIEKEDKKVLEFLSKIEHIKIYSSSNDMIGNEMKEIAKKYKKANQMETLMSVFNKGRKSEFFVKSSNDHEIHELVMFFEGSNKDESILILFSMT